MFKGVKQFGFAVEQLRDGSWVSGLDTDEVFSGFKFGEEPAFASSVGTDSDINGVTDDLAVSFLRIDFSHKNWTRFYRDPVKRVVPNKLANITTFSGVI